MIKYIRSQMHVEGPPSQLLEFSQCVSVPLMFVSVHVKSDTLCSLPVYSLQIGFESPNPLRPPLPALSASLPVTAQQKGPGKGSSAGRLSAELLALLRPGDTWPTPCRQ